MKFFISVCLLIDDNAVNCCVLLEQVKVTGKNVNKPKHRSMSGGKEARE
jgi:hypothetical protein